MDNADEKKSPAVQQGKLSKVREELDKIQLDKCYTFGGARVLNNDLNAVATEVVKLLALRSFSAADLAIILSLAFYRITGQWRPIVGDANTRLR